MSAVTLCSVPVVPSPPWPWDNNIKQGMHCHFFLSPHLSASFLTPLAVSSLRGSIRLTNWEFQPPFVSASPGTLLLALNPGIPPDPQPQGPRAHRDSPSRGVPQGEEPRSSGMKQNVSDVMNWTSVSSEGKKRKNSSALMRDAKIFWSVDRLPPAPHSWNKHCLIYWPLGMIFFFSPGQYLFFTSDHWSISSRHSMLCIVLFSSFGSLPASNLPAGSLLPGMWIHSILDFLNMISSSCASFIFYSVALQEHFVSLLM